MLVNLNSRSVIEIQPHGIVTLAPGIASELIVERGSLWVTDTSSQTDWMLDAGDHYTPPYGATVYVEALSTGAVRLIEA